MKKEDEIPGDVFELALERVKLMPEHLEINIGGHGRFNRGQLIEHLEKRDEIGKIVAEMQLKALRSFKED